jgi:hypothetical protein
VILHKVCAWVFFSTLHSLSSFPHLFFDFVFGLLRISPTFVRSFHYAFSHLSKLFLGEGESSSRGEVKIFVGFCQERIDGWGRIEICKRCGDLDEKKENQVVWISEFCILRKKVRYLFCVSFSSI